MTEEDLNKAVKKEKNKIVKELKRANISGYKMKVFLPVVENVATMKVKLDELKDQIVKEDLLIEYDNGGGQKGIRENPIFKRYESLFKTFMLGMNKILDAIPDEDKSQEKAIKEAEPQTVLEMLRDKKRDAS